MSDRICPEYRLRLFLSVDLVGSTAFKARFGDSDPSVSPSPKWVDQIRHFYREFPEIYLRQYEKAVDLLDVPGAKGKCPVVWKTIGDEIVLCGRLLNIEHLSISVQAFIKTLAIYGDYLDGEGKHLDVKGYGWTAAFPSPNVLVEVISRRSAETSATTYASELPDEATELRADLNPNEFDFLGKEIDSGFRTGKFCTADRLVMSLELAYLVATAAQARVLNDVRFTYSGREGLKGVLKDRPYPIVAIDAERNVSRSEVRQREQAVTGNGRYPEPMLLVDFLEAFMLDEEVEIPQLLRANDPTPIELPPSYLAFKSNWSAADEEIARREENESAAANADAGNRDNPEALDTAVTTNLSMYGRDPATGGFLRQLRVRPDRYTTKLIYDIEVLAVGGEPKRVNQEVRSITKRNKADVDGLLRTFPARVARVSSSLQANEIVARLSAAGATARVRKRLISLTE